MKSDDVLAYMQPGRSYKPAILAAHFKVGIAAMRLVLGDLESQGKLQSSVHIRLRHWHLPLPKKEAAPVEAAQRSGLSNMPDYSRARERIAEFRAIPSRHI